MSELRAVWHGLLVTFGRDLGLTARLAADPVGVMGELGYDIGERVVWALRLVTA